MGVFDFLKKQFIDVIEWTENNNGTLMFNFPTVDREIQNGAILTVRESQLALFVNEGEVADVFEPGKHVLNTNTLPLLSSLKNWDKLFKSPFKSDVFFFSTREQIDQRWGTTSPISIREKEFGTIRVRANGTFSYRIKNPRVFFKKISGTRDVYTTEELDNQLRSMILAHMGAFFGSSNIPFLDMAANQLKFSDALKASLNPLFEEYGLVLQNFFVQSISVPEELQKYLDKNTQMNIIGDTKRYAQFQAADNIDEAMKASGGLAGAGAGLGAGIAMGQTLSQAMGSTTETKEDPMAVLSKLHELMKQGILTQAEFDAKKTDLLKKM